MAYLDTIDQNVDPIDEPSGATAVAINRNQLVVYGQQITFKVLCRDVSGEVFSPSEIAFDIHRDPLYPMTRIFLFSKDEIINQEVGIFSITINIPEFLVPAMYTARWSFTDNGDQVRALEQFFVVDPPVVNLELTDAPRISGVIREAVNYNELGLGTTDPICLIGHGDGLSMNDPYQVIDMQETINRLQADSASPLLRGLLEAYHGGCRDIWIVAASPMREYEGVLASRFNIREDWGNRNFYERYAQRLQETYRILKDYSTFDVIVPIEAPFYDTRGVDFFTPLAGLCLDIFTSTAQPVVGVIGTRYDTIDDNDIIALENDPRIQSLKTNETLQYAGKFILVALGEATVKIPYLPEVNSGSLSIAAGSYLCANSLRRGLTYSELPTVENIKGTDLRRSQIDKLTKLCLNPAIRTPVGKRGIPYNVVLATDNTMAPDGSDYWSILQVRLVSRVIRNIKQMGDKFIGTIGFASFNNDLKLYFQNLRNEGFLRDATFNLTTDELTRGAATVDIILYPFYGIREIGFFVDVGAEKPITLSSKYADNSQIVSEDLLNVELSDAIIIIE